MSYTAKVIAVLGRTVRAGRWKLADDSLVIAVFGRCALDLSRAYVDEDDDELSMTVFALFGSVSIVLPPGCDVEPSGIAILASSEVEIPSDKADDITQAVLAPMDISWFAMFGRVRINELALEPETAEFDRTNDTLAPPAVEVFGSGAEPDLVIGTPPTTDPLAEDPVVEDGADAAAEAESEQAALRDEIAQWRTETGRPEPEAETARAENPRAETPRAEPADAGSDAPDDDSSAPSEDTADLS